MPKWPGASYEGNSGDQGLFKERFEERWRAEPRLAPSQSRNKHGTARGPRCSPLRTRYTFCRSLGTRVATGRTRS
eukprot:4844059-Prymnesium_polylepis.1